MVDITVAAFFTWIKWRLTVTWEPLCINCLGADIQPPTVLPLTTVPVQRCRTLQHISALVNTRVNTHEQHVNTQRNHNLQAAMSCDSVCKRREAKWSVVLIHTVSNCDCIKLDTYIFIRSYSGSYKVVRNHAKRVIIPHFMLLKPSAAWPARELCLYWMNLQDIIYVRW